MKAPKFCAWMVASLFVFTLLACSGGGSGSSATGDAASDGGIGTGTLSLMLTDAPTEDLDAVYVTIDEVQVHVVEGETGYWRDAVLLDPDKTYNLLDFVDGETAELGTCFLPAGFYTQMRLIIGLEPEPDALNKYGDLHEYANYVLVNGFPEDQEELKIPSGVQTGIKLVHPFEIVEGLTVSLILDFDAQKSVHMTGESGKYILKPTIKVIDTKDNATITGLVHDDDGNPVIGARVTAQAHNGGPSIVESGTQTNGVGSYTMYVAPGTYCVVAYKPPPEDAYGPGCAPTGLLYYDDILQIDFIPALDTELIPTATGNVTGTVQTFGNDVTLSFRILGCGDPPCNDLIEVWWRTVPAVPDPYTPVDYTVGLPPGDYQVVAYSDTAPTQTLPATVAAYSETTGIGFDFTP
jgi:hypothetical protein